MKFAKVLQESLKGEDVPQQWVQAAIQYKALKKCIGKVVEELKFLGFEQNAMKLLIQDPEDVQSKVIDVNHDYNPKNPVLAEYILTKAMDNGKTGPKGAGHPIVPMLKITIDYSEQLNVSDDQMNAISAKIKQKIESVLAVPSSKRTPTNLQDELNAQFQDLSGARLQTLELLETLNISSDSDYDSSGEERIYEIREENDEYKLSPTTSHVSSSRETSPPPPGIPMTSSRMPGIEESLSEVQEEPVKQRKQEIYIMLNSDVKFFDMLNEELEGLDHVREDEETKMISQITDLSQKVSTLVAPGKNSRRSDLYLWRELFRIYLDSEVYFRYNDVNSSAEKNTEQIKKNLEQFLENVNKLQIVSHFKQKKSLEAFNEFIQMNFHLLKVLDFQYLNSEAFRKILKKFDKQTSLGVQSRFPDLVLTDHIFFSGKTLAKTICYIMQDHLITLVPQLEDYTCPICCSVAYKPIRLECGHLFCVRCLVKMKQQRNTNCPMCRHERAIELASGANLDMEAMEIMEKYFPLEVKAKLKERSSEKYSDFAGSHDGKCNVL